MKKIIITSLMILTSNIFLVSQWGPKIKLEFINDEEQTAKLFFGVDSLATDGWDKNINFHYKDLTTDTTLTEDIDLPPPPPQRMYCRLLRDTTPGNICYSYADFRDIPSDTLFYHRYVVNIVWYSSSINPYINIKWGDLPDGIDSAKFRCYQWMNDDSVVNMREKSEILLDNEAYKICYVYVWFNKKHSGILNEKLDVILFPNPANELITFYNEDYNSYSIVNSAGSELSNGMLELNLNNHINTQNIPAGSYYMLLNKKGKNSNIPFIKK